jgi:tetratricopeptide (TPR) repeat protein
MRTRRSTRSVVRQSVGLVLLGALFLALTAPVRAESASDQCYSEDWNRRIAGCTAIIESDASSPTDKSQAYAMRALALSLKQQYGEAIEDYDRAIAIMPNFAVALNNRAWAYYKWGRGAQGLADVEKSLLLNPLSEHTWDTRAHIRQVIGNHAGAFADYERAVDIGGERMIKLYQCGLAAQGLYKGRFDGYDTPELRSALKTCAYSSVCDPLPADEECRDPTS